MEKKYYLILHDKNGRQASSWLFLIFNILKPLKGKNVFCFDRSLDKVVEKIMIIKHFNRPPRVEVICITPKCRILFPLAYTTSYTFYIVWRLPSHMKYLILTKPNFLPILWNTCDIQLSIHFHDIPFILSQKVLNLPLSPHSLYFLFKA